MKFLTLIVLFFSLIACTSSTKQRVFSETIAFSEKELNDKRSEIGNDSVDLADILFARMQNVPIPSLNFTKENLVKELRRSRVKIVSENENTIVVAGSSKSRRQRMTTSNPNKFEYKFKDGLLISGPNARSIFHRYVVAEDGDLQDVTPELALQAIQRFKENPLEIDSRSLSNLVDFTRESKSVIVSYSSKNFPWSIGNLDEELEHKLICAFVAGNVEYQLKNGVNENRTIEGIKFFAKVYKEFQRSGNYPQLKNIDRWIEKKLGS